MFINKTKFKKLVKDTYSGGGLLVGQTESGILIVGGEGWQLEIDKEYMCKEHLAAIIECTGYIPEKGEAIKFIKHKDGCEEQETMIETAYQDLLSEWAERANDKGCQYSFTRLILASDNGYQWVMQNNTCAQEKCFMYNHIAMMVDRTLVDTEAGEEFPVFASRSNDCFMFFGNNTMVLMVKKWTPVYDGEIELAQKLTEVKGIYPLIASN